MKSTIRTSNRFEYWSVDDCSCVYCLFYGGARRGCTLGECCCDDIRQEALRREQAANAEYRLREAALCQA